MLKNLRIEFIGENDIALKSLGSCCLLDLFFSNTIDSKLFNNWTFIFLLEGIIILGKLYFFNGIGKHVFKGLNL
jgi:hypothetical protein